MNFAEVNPILPLEQRETIMKNMRDKKTFIEPIYPRDMRTRSSINVMAWICHRIRFLRSHCSPIEKPVQSTKNKRI